MHCRSVFLCAAALLVASGVSASDKPAPEKPKAGLKAGNDLPGPFRPYNITGKYAKKFHCLSDEHGLNPGVMIVVQNMPTDDMAVIALMRGLDQYIAEKPQSRLNAFAVFLHNDLTDVVKEDETRAKYVDELTKINSEKPLTHLVLSLDSNAALKAAGYDIDPEWRVAVILYDKLQVTKGVEVYAFKGDKPMMDADAKAIVKEVKENLAPVKK